MPEPAPLTTPLHAWHQAHGARLVEFGGWSMPVQYTSIVEEHRAVRERVGLFDISHMGRLGFEGPDAAAWIDRVTTNHVARLGLGQIQYSLMLSENGGVLDDILVYRRTREPFVEGAYQPAYLVVCNASNRTRVVAQFERHQRGFDAVLDDSTVGRAGFSSAMIAVQGPAAATVVSRILDANSATALATMKSYTVPDPARVRTADGSHLTYALISRTGYTGEDGFELIVYASKAEEVWNLLLDAGRDLGILPCGLGARDTLRFEAGMPLYGHELSETINPYEAGLGWAVKLGKGEFVGRQALRKLKDELGRTRIGLELEGKRIARQGCPVKQEDRVVGEVTSGTFSPTLGKSLAMALVERGASALGASLSVAIRGHDEPARVVPLPFYRRPAPAPAGA